MTGTEMDVMTSTGEVQFSERPQTSLEMWAGDLAQAYTVARQLVTTSFVPESYKGKPEEAAAAIMAGAELRLSPLASLRSIDIIHGVPGMRAIALRALVQSHGHQIWTEESTAERAIVKGRRKGEDKVETSTWTMDRARGLQLVGKDNWKKQPIAMLLARATSELARLIAADVLLGIPYSIEELQDLSNEDVAAVGGDVPAPKRATRSVKRAALDPQRGEAPEPDGAVSRQEPSGEPVDDTPAVLVEDAEASSGAVSDTDAAAEAEQLRIEEQRRLAAEAFMNAPELEEPPIDWEPPTGEA